MFPGGCASPGPCPTGKEKGAGSESSASPSAFTRVYCFMASEATPGGSGVTAPPSSERQFQLRCYSLYPKLCRAPGRARTSHSVCSKKSTKSTEITAKSRSSGKTKSRRVPSAGGGRAEQFTLFSSVYKYQEQGKRVFATLKPFMASHPEVGMREQPRGWYQHLTRRDCTARLSGLSVKQREKSSRSWERRRERSEALRSRTV